MEKLCIHYGSKVGSLPSEDGYVYYDFPHPSALAHPSVEQNLRNLGFGYRAKYIQSTAYTIAHVKPSGWLTSLRTLSYPKAKESLLELSGVGPKVADCVVSPIVMMLI
jgi:N-glycosylase/DNA lyase